jgi:hypothetical protein
MEDKRKTHIVIYPYYIYRKKPGKLGKSTIAIFDGLKPEALNDE